MTLLRFYKIFAVTVTTDHVFRHLEGASTLLEPHMAETAERERLAFTCRASESPITPDAEPIYCSPYQTSEGETASYLYRLTDQDLMRFPAVDFFLRPGRIECRLHDPDREHLVELRLLGPVFAYWLECRGIRALHGSAVAIDGRAVGFLTGSGGGKTSLAAHLMKSGHSLLTDDVLAVEETSRGFYARPSYPRMRMWPDELALFVGRDEELELVHPAHAKRRVPVGGDGWGTFCETSLPLAALYLPQRVAESMGSGCEITPLSPRDAVIELVRHSFQPFIVEAAGLQPERLDFFARFLRQVRVRRLVYPEGFDGLPEVADAILEDLA